MSQVKTVVHITTVHHPLDPRIYYKECQTLQQVGYHVKLIVPIGQEEVPKDEVTIVPIKKYKNKLQRMLFSTVEAYRAARKVKAQYYHIHDPELLPVAWLLKNKTNTVIYDIHEDYETSIMQKEYLLKPFRRLVAKAYKAFERFFTKNLELCLAEKYYKEKYPKGVCVLNYPILMISLLNGQSIKKPKAN
ncbi:MAG: hypothetical protein LRY71_18485 [Bacillaceae bacterium]|nr:hypothetical protein [Bacillaceae bacterium]